MLDKQIYKKRVEHVKSHLENEGTDFALLTPSPNFQYLTGIETEMRERLVALMIQPNAEPRMIVPSFELDNFSKQSWISEFVVWEEDEDPYLSVKDCLNKQDNLVAAFDNTLPIGIFWKIEKSLGRLKSNSLSPLIHGMRLTKSDVELDLMRKAGKIIDKAVTKAFQSASIGVTELELKQVVNDEIIKAGASPTFAAVQFGVNTAYPHYGGGSVQLEKQDMILMDCGCSLDGYNTDMTRVGVVGNPTEEQETVYATVLEAQKSALEQIGPGVNCGTADGFARRVIDHEGYGEFFTHRLGHGIGLEVHEEPYLVRGNPNTLAPGMTHSVEPGIYMEGLFGVRIEDLVAITDDGLEVITYMPKSLYEINP